MSLPPQLSPHLAGALHRVNVPSYVLDRNGRVRWMNDAARELVGDVHGRPVTSVIAPEDVGTARDAFERKLRGEKRTDYDVTVLCADGSRRKVGISSVPLGSSEHAIGVFGLAVPQEQEGAPKRHPHLTPRQSEVLHLLGSGSSTEQIAHMLHLSRETVRNHVRHVLRALGAHSRLEAVAIGHRDGLL